MRRIGSPAALAAGWAVLLVANALILGAAAWNRSGGARARIELTERELALPVFREKDDTAVLLSLVPVDQPPASLGDVAIHKGYRVAPVTHRWLDRHKLEALGFDVDLDPTDRSAKEHYKKALARTAFVAYEFDGEAWRAWLAEREARIGVPSKDPGEDVLDPAVLAFDRVVRSRLVPVDAAIDAGELELRYPDRGRYAVLAAVIVPRLSEPKDGTPTIEGRISELTVQRIQVPLPLRPQLEKFLPGVTAEEYYRGVRERAKSGWPTPTPPRYRAVLAIGRRHEPWLVSVTPIEKTDTP